MNRKTIELNTEKQLKIYMDPVRQRIIRTMSVTGKPMTPKRLADTMKITPSAAKHHLLQLESLGLVEADHTESIHGITATFYRLIPAEVRMGMDKEDYREEKSILAENMLKTVYENFRGKVYAHPEKASNIPFSGDLLTGIAHLTQKEADELYAMITKYIAGHEAPSENTVPFEYALILYNAGIEHETAL